MANPADVRFLKAPFISRRHLIGGASALAGAAMLPGFARGQGAAPLVWYTGSQVEAVDMWVKMFKEKTGQTCDYYRAGGLNIARKYEQELKANQIKCSLVGGGLTGLFKLWADKGMLTSYKSPEYAHYPADTILPNDTGGPIKADITSMIYNSEMIKPEDAPKTYEDLLDPKWKGRMVMSDAGSSAGALHWFSAVRKAFGRSYLEKLAKQDILIRTGSGEVVNTVVSGERPLAAMVLIYHAQIAMSKGAKNLKIIIPTEGVPVSWSHICIAKDPPNLEWAQKFLDFTMSKEAQLAWRDKFFTGSARDDLPPPPEGAIAVDKVKRLASTSADLQEYFEKNAEISDEWTDLFKS